MSWSTRLWPLACLALASLIATSCGGRGGFDRAAWEAYLEPLDPPAPGAGAHLARAAELMGRHGERLFDLQTRPGEPSILPDYPLDSLEPDLQQALAELVAWHRAEGRLPWPPCRGFNREVVDLTRLALASWDGSPNDPRVGAALYLIDRNWREDRSLMSAFVTVALLEAAGRRAVRVGAAPDERFRAVAPPRDFAWRVLRNEVACAHIMIAKERDAGATDILDRQVEHLARFHYDLLRDAERLAGDPRALVDLATERLAAASESNRPLIAVFAFNGEILGLILDSVGDYLDFLAAEH